MQSWSKWSNWIFVLFTPHLMSHAQYTWSSLKIFQAQKYLQVKNCNDFRHNVRLSLCLCCDFLLHPQLVILEFWKLEICKYAKENPRNLHFLSLSFSLFLFHFPLWPWRECTDSGLHHSWLRTSSIEIERFRSQIVVVSNFGAFNFVHISDIWEVRGRAIRWSTASRKRRTWRRWLTSSSAECRCLPHLASVFLADDGDGKGWRESVLTIRRLAWAPRHGWKVVGCQRTGPLLSGSHGKSKRRQVGNKVTAKNWQHGLLAIMVAIFFSS